VEVRNRVHHNTVVGAIELAELGDGVVPTPRVTLKLRRMPYDPLNLGGTVRYDDRGELIRRQPRMFAMASKNIEEVGEIFAVKGRGSRRVRTRHRLEWICER
jgi:hypothetical protein